MRRASNVIDNRDELRLGLHGLGGSLVELAAIAQLCFGIGRLIQTLNRQPPYITVVAEQASAE
jgi:hypothetical protein